MFKIRMMQKAYIEMINKSTFNIGNDLNQGINALMNHVENLSYFYDECKTEKRKNELSNEIKKKPK